MKDKKWSIPLPALPGPKFRPLAVSNPSGISPSDLTPPHAEVQTFIAKGETVIDLMKWTTSLLL